VVSAEVTNCLRDISLALAIEFLRGLWDRRFSAPNSVCSSASGS
jgi:hypothetical protein